MTANNHFHSDPDEHATAEDEEFQEEDGLEDFEEEEGSEKSSENDSDDDVIVLYDED